MNVFSTIISHKDQNRCTTYIPIYFQYQTLSIQNLVIFKIQNISRFPCMYVCIHCHRCLNIFYTHNTLRFYLVNCLRTCKHVVKILFQMGKKEVSTFTPYMMASLTWFRVIQWWDQRWWLSCLIQTLPNWLVLDSSETEVAGLTSLVPQILFFVTYPVELRFEIWKFCCIPHGNQ